MQCAVCDSTLIKKSFNNNQVEFCENCNGYWFDGDEAKAVIYYFVQLRVTKSNGNDIKVKNSELKTGYCPKCNHIAKPVYIHEITFLKCVNCQGIWIDADNLTTLTKGWRKYKNFFGNLYLAPKKRPELIQAGKIIESYTGWLDDTNPTNRIPFSTILLIVLNLIGFIIWDPTFSSSQDLLFTPSKFKGNPNLNWTTIISSLFIHANFNHLFGNMFYLYIFGNNVEDRIGPYKYILIYIFFGIIASLGYSFITSQPEIPTLGASGAVSGILGCYLFLYPKVNMKIHKTFFFIPYMLNIPIWFYLGVWFLGQQLFGIIADIQGIAWYAHIFGFITGYIVMFLMKKNNFL